MSAQLTSEWPHPSRVGTIQQPGGEFSRMATEDRNPRTTNLDLLETRKMLELFNREDQSAVQAVSKVLDQIAEAVDRMAERLRSGGRVFYVGAGTSGRLGVLDSVECRPTFGVDAELFQALMAGGDGALLGAVEGAEDDEGAGEADLRARDLTRQDVVVGLSASGTTPYTLGAVLAARSRGALTIGVACNQDTELGRIAEIPIEVETGPEVIAGSTRLKAGTAQKLILNMLSSGTMIRLGYVYSNLMTHVRPLNRKLRQRVLTIIAEAAECSQEHAVSALDESGDVATAIVMIKKGVAAHEARSRLERTSNLREALDERPRPDRDDGREK